MRWCLLTVVLEAPHQKNWCLQTLVLGKTPESPLDSKEIKPVNLKGNQLWILVRRADAEADAPVFWSSDVSNRLFGKALNTGKDWGQKEKGVTEDKTVGWYHWCNEYELGQILGDGERQGSLSCCSPWGHRVGHDWVTKQQYEMVKDREAWPWGCKELDTT